MDRELLMRAVSAGPQELPVLQRASGREDSPSLLQGRTPTAAEIGNAVAQLSLAFPKMPDEFWALLASRIQANGKSKVWLDYAVPHLIDNHPYATMTVADLFNTDRNVKIYSYEDVCCDGENYILCDVGWISRKDYMEAPHLFSVAETNRDKAERWLRTEGGTAV